MAAPISIASAQAPPEAGVGEYTENIPGAGGDQPSGGGNSGSGQGDSGQGGSGGGSGSGDPAGGASDTAPSGTESGLPPEVVDEFQQQGADGAAAANLAQSTSPGGSAGNGGSGGGSGGTGAVGELGSGGGQSGVAGAVEKIVGANTSGSDSDGMGVVLPIILGASVVGALLFLLLRRRDLGPPGNA